MRLDVLLPNDIDDPARPSGGNAYDRRVCRGLAAAGWAVQVHEVTDATLTAALAEIPDRGLVLADGLVASPAPEVLVPEARRLRLVVLVHMPLGDEREGAVLAAAPSVGTTTARARRWL